MTIFNSRVPSLALSFAVTGLAALGTTSTAQAGDHPSCEDSNFNDPYGRCAMSTQCGIKHHVHQAIEFDGNFVAHFDRQNYPAGGSCEIVAHKYQVNYNCEDRDGRDHRGVIVYSDYPTSNDPADYFKLCEKLRGKFVAGDPGCGKPDKPDCGEPEPDPGCGKPDKPDCGEPEPEPEPGCGKPNKPDCGKPKNPKDPKKPGCGKPGCGDPKPGCEKPGHPGCDKPKMPSEKAYRDRCVSHHGHCSVFADSAYNSSHSSKDAFSKLAVRCACNTGVQWNYEQNSASYEPLGAEQLEEVCEAELALCEKPLEGGQATTFELDENKPTENAAKCSTSFGRCAVTGDANGNGYVDCTCNNPDTIGNKGMVYVMEPGAQGVMTQCFDELDACTVETDHCPGGCEKDGVGDADIWDCSMTPSKERGPFGAMLVLFAGVAGFGLRRRK